jgi:hypothetical protein
MSHWYDIFGAYPTLTCAPLDCVRFATPPHWLDVESCRDRQTAAQCRSDNRKKELFMALSKLERYDLGDELGRYAPTSEFAIERNLGS